MRKTLMTMVLAAAACGGLATGASDGDTTVSSLEGGKEDATATTTTASYADVEEWANEQGDDAWQTWRGILDTLNHDFDDVCGDTFCEGDYSNLEALRFRCSINTTTKVLKNCTYVFAGSYETVNTSTGTIKVNAKTFSCHVSVTGIKLSDFESTLTAAGSTAPLQRTLPGKSQSIYDQLVGCI
jgi:hypothetical protein